VKTIIIVIAPYRVNSLDVTTSVSRATQ